MTIKDTPLTVRQINRLLRTGHAVVARYRYPEDPIVFDGRIMRARRRQGVVEVHALNTGRWVVLDTPQSVWVAEEE